MGKIRAAQLTDLLVVSSYLHDSTFKSNEVALTEGRLSIGIDRPGYEYGRRRRALFLVPVMTYPWVAATIELSKVRDLDWTWHQKREQVEDIRTNLLEIEASETEIKFHADYFVLTAKLERFEVLEVADKGGPTPSGGISDLFARVVRVGDAVDQLRVDV